VIPPLAPTFDAALRDVRAQQPRFRRAAAARLGEPPPGREGEALEGVRSLCGDAEGEVRATAFESLGMLEAGDARAALQAGFEDRYPPARQAAVLALGRVDPENAALDIAPLLTDPRPDMRFSAVWTLSLLGAEHAAAIAGALTDEDPEVRLLSAQCLGDLEALGCADAIASLLEDPHEEVRFAAATALAGLGDSRAAAPLRSALTHRERAFAAAVGLGDLEDAASHAALGRLAKQRFRSPILRAAAARALVRLGDPGGARIIQKLVRSWRIEARQYAAQLVGELGLVALVPDLAKGLRRGSDAERAVYQTALELLAPKSNEAKALLASIQPADHPD